MRFQAVTTAAMAIAFLPAANAFWLVTNTIEGGIGGPVGGTGNQWSFVSNPDDCAEIKKAQLYNQYSDVSGKNGVRISWKKGSGSACDAFLGCQVPKVVEMHRDQWHWTWYSGQGNGQLRNVNNKVVGHCRQAMGHVKGCSLPAGAYAHVQSLIQCDVN